MTINIATGVNCIAMIYNILAVTEILKSGKRMVKGI